ncbi:retinal guanylyl cyclase 2-like isoform X2 [Chiloscyllium plagiosum]|uniref:retinal guanylyl cyclase 2-like isoform X2 n=1 Tax=Chiloscyllium plagiosum TaxID=36176 RepID=UPI001CB80C14|nr:retinal guanylyl cyclase 2-like isoform X2 [Chiloscyllium plagiosum]
MLQIELLQTPLKELGLIFKCTFQLNTLDYHRIAMSYHFSCFSVFTLKLSNHPIWTDTKNQGFASYLLSPFQLVCTILLSLMLPHSVQCATYKVGIIGPWRCDPIFAKALPNVAAKLAIDRINKDSSLSLGNHFDYVILNEDCQTSKALAAFLDYSELASGFIGPTNPGYCDAASLLGKNWNRIIFSWACINYEMDDTLNYPTFMRTLPSPTRVLFTVMKYFRWAHVAIISSMEDIWVDTAVKVASALRKQGLPVGAVLSMDNEPGTVRSTLKKIKTIDKVRMIIMCMHSIFIGGEVQKHLLEVAHDLQMTDGSYVFIPYDTLLYSLPYQNTPYPVLVNNSKLQKAYDSVLTITVDSAKMSFHQAFQEHVQSREIITHLKPHQVSPLFGTIYNAIYFLAKAMENNRKHQAWMSGSNIAKFAKDIRFEGFNQRIWTDKNGDSFTDYVILDTDGKGTELYHTYIVDMETDLIQLTGRTIHFPNGVLPKTDSACWFTRGKICTGGIDPFFAVTVPLMIIFAVLFSMGLVYCIRRRIIQLKLLKGPDKILLTLNDVTFINPQLSKKKISGEDSQLSEGGQSGSETRSRKSPMWSLSMRSLTPATHENSNVAVYEGDWVWLKKFPYEEYGNIKPGASAMFEMMKDFRHENINVFLGFFFDCGMLAIVTEFCTRGSLLDLLRNEDVKLDWMFKSSLLLDLIKGMRYLHHREYVHGNLKSRNCVVDGRFVLKVTDYGYIEVAKAQNIPLMEPPAEEFLWTAPEILRKPNPLMNGTFKGDIYSFAIIMQEVVIRGPPYCMFDLSAEEIIENVKKPPPLLRPIITQDHAPMECIQLMRQCWNEIPERRPSFDEVFDNFRNINKGRKTNIIDSMLRMLEQYSSNLEDLIRERTEELEIEKQKTEKLLTQMLPPSVSESLKTGCTVEPEYFDQVTLYFSDIVGFTTISAMSEPIEVVDLLNDLYTLFDAVLENHDVYKVETIGDAYMVVSGLPTRNGNRHAAEIANMSLDILSAVGTFKMRHMPDVPVRIRIGLHSGPSVAGVVGLTMPRYCLFGDTVTTASRMESTGQPYRIHVNHTTVKILISLNEGYKLEPRERTELMGQGFEQTYWLVGKEGFTKPLPKPPELKPGQSTHGLQMEEMARYKQLKAQKQQKP